jgi:hypothetical protein
MDHHKEKQQNPSNGYEIFHTYWGKIKWETLEFEINGLEKKLNSEFINIVRREMITMACLCEKSR